MVKIYKIITGDDIMQLYDYLLKNYGYDNPIIVNELEVGQYKMNAIRQAIYLLEKEDKIVRYSTGIYYIARDTIFGKSKISFEIVIKKKYIENDRDIYGYFTGLYFKNLLGLTTQMVNTPEIVSNKEFSKKRTVEMCGRNAIVRKSNVVITKANAKILQFFDLFKYLTFEEVNTYKEQLINYIKENSLSKQMVVEYLSYYSKKVIDLIVRSGLIYEFA